MRTAVRLATASAVIVSTMTLQAAVAAHRGLPSTIHPCVYEDGSGGPLPCYWDASHRGNGLGRSFIVTRNGSVHYLGRR